MSDVQSKSYVNLLKKYNHVKLTIYEQCGEDCFAHATASLVSFEIQRANRSYRNYEASIQHIVDQTFKSKVDGVVSLYKYFGPGDNDYEYCDESDMTFYDCDAIAPLSYVQRYGVCLESDHPYLLGAFDRNAQTPIVSEKIKVRKIVLLGGSHIEAKKAIDRGHPFIGAITVFPDLGTFEGKGIYRNKLKNKNKNWARHALLVVGYGVTFSGEEYYIVQNSWGDDWGTMD